jgi:very-short-patch-repair endonuclease
MLTIDALVAAGDSLLGHTNPDPAGTIEWMRESITGDGRRGVRKLRAAIELMRSGVRSAAETRLRLLLHRAGLPEPQVNLRIYGTSGQFLAEGDLVYEKQRVIVEYEGDYHRTDVAKFRSDIHRRERMDDHGWSTIRVTADDLTLRPDETVSRVRLRLARSTRQ